MLLVFPNYAARQSGAALELESNHSQLLAPLCDADCDVSIAAAVDVSGDDIPYRAVTDRRIRLRSLGRVGTSRRPVSKVWEYLRMQAAIVFALREADFAYVFMPGHVGSFVLLWSLVLRRPYGVYLRGDWRQTTPRGLWWLVPVALRRARFVLCTGTALAAELRALNPRVRAVVPMSPVLTLPAGADANVARTSRSRILFVGQLSDAKGVNELVDAVAMLVRRGASAVSLSFVGTGPERAALAERVRAAGIENRVTFHGQIHDAAALAAIYRDHDIFCLPTHHEGFPRVIYEAMLLGLPVVTTRVGQIDTVVRSGVNGLFAAVRDAADLADKIATLITDPDLANRLAAAGLETIRPWQADWARSSHGHQVLELMRESGVSCAG